MKGNPRKSHASSFRIRLKLVLFSFLTYDWRKNDGAGAVSLIIASKKNQSSVHNRPHPLRRVSRWLCLACRKVESLRRDHGRKEANHETAPKIKGDETIFVISFFQGFSRNGAAPKTHGTQTTCFSWQ
jgi:hypothetical protein